MPYLPSDAAKKSEIYNNILNGSEIEYQKEIDFLKEQQQISSSVDANTPLRDDDGFLVSIEDPRNPGQAAEGITESVRIENKQQFFNDRYLGNINQTFSHFTPPNDVDVPNDDDIVDAVEEVKAAADLGETTDPYRPIIVKFIDEVLREKSLKSSQIKASAKIFFTGINVDGIESIDENISNDKLNALIAKVVSAFRPTGKKKAKTLKGFVKQIKTYQIDLKIALDLRDYATIIRDFIFANKVLRRFYKELGLPETFTTQTGAEFNLIKPPTISAEDERVVSVEDEEELRGKGYII